MTTQFRCMLPYNKSPFGAVKWTLWDSRIECNLVSWIFNKLKRKKHKKYNNTENRKHLSCHFSLFYCKKNVMQYDDTQIYRFV